MLSLATVAAKPRTGCWPCAHLAREEESWELPDVHWYECKARPRVSTLRQFPFKNTTCSRRSVAS